MRFPLPTLDAGSTRPFRSIRAIFSTARLAALLCFFPHPLYSLSASIVYERDIAPIFRTYCAGCHNNQELKGELTLETYRSLRKGGADEGDPIKPGKPDESFMIRSMEGRSTPKMPPRDEPRVPASELARLRQWIAEGAAAPESDVSILENIVTPPIPHAPGLQNPITAASFSPDGKTLAIGSFQQIELRNVADDRLIRSLANLPGKITALHFSPDGHQLVAATGITGLRGVAILWNVEQGKILREFARHRDVLYDAEFSPDGQLLATAGYDRVIRLWRVRDGELIRSIDVHKGAVFDLAFHPDGTVLASASADETVKLWRVSDGTRLDTLNQPQGEQYTVCFTPDGNHILSGGADRRIHMWQFVSRQHPAINPVVHSRFAHESPLIALTITPDGRNIISAAADRTLKVWSLPSLIEQHAYETQPDAAAVLAGIPGTKRFWSFRMDGSIGRYAVINDAPEEKPIETPSAIVADSSSTVRKISESEPNDLPKEATPITVPMEISGSIERENDADLFRFSARAGQELTLEINAARSKSRLDSRVEVLHGDGEPVEQVLLQAVRDSWFTFRGKDSETADDFRLHNWREMELDEYLYANGEVVRLWLYPRGPDSGFKVYPGSGKRHTAFFTTALSHPLSEPCYVVKPLPRGSHPAPNGLPVFRLNYENDDDPSRRFGTDSLILFTAPEDGEYLARVTDVRGFGSEKDYPYTLTIRSPHPDFTVTFAGKNPKVSPGSGREITFNVERYEGFTGPVTISMENLPAGFSVSAPVIIEAEQRTAIGTLYADPSVTSSPDEAAENAIKIVAKATIQGHEITKDLGTIGDIQIGDSAKVTVEILPSEERSYVKESAEGLLEFTIHPGQTITARVRATRHDFDGRIELGNEDSGRNLPHGVYVDNIGLNGLLIVEGQTEREFFITASAIAQPGTRMFHLRATADGGQASRPALLRVLPRNN